jgi:hypothetical protein
MESQGEVVQVLQGLEGEVPHGAVAHAGEDHIAQLVERGAGQAQRPVGEQQDYRQRQGAGIGLIQVVDNFL